MRYSVLVDTSAFHALENRGDVLEHLLAKQVAEKLDADGALLVTTDGVGTSSGRGLRSGDSKGRD